MKLIIAGVIVLILAGFGAYAYYERGTARTVTVTVQDKIRTGGNDSKYLIFTNHGVYENTDAMWWGKFDSSDIYGRLHRGGTYSCKVFGWRSHFMSIYPDIISCEAS